MHMRKKLTKFWMTAIKLLINTKKRCKNSRQMQMLNRWLRNIRDKLSKRRCSLYENMKIISGKFKQERMRLMQLIKKKLKISSLTLLKWERNLKTE